MQVKIQLLAQFPFFLHVLQSSERSVLVLLSLSAMLPKLINPPFFTEMDAFSSYFHPLFISFTTVHLVILFSAKMTQSQEHQLWML